MVSTGARSSSSFTISWTIVAQPPQPVAAPQARATWPTLVAPFWTILRIWRSVIRRQWQTINAAGLHGRGWGTPSASA
jgi:hypothetical protein